MKTDLKLFMLRIFKILSFYFGISLLLLSCDHAVSQWEEVKSELKESYIELKADVAYETKQLKQNVLEDFEEFKIELQQGLQQELDKLTSKLNTYGLNKSEAIEIDSLFIATGKELAAFDEDDEDSKSISEKILIVSWNIQHMGGSKSNKDIAQMAQILRHADIVAIQEVVAKDPAGAQAVARLADALNRTGAQWDYQVSDPTESPSVYISERYAYLWKPSKVQIQHRAFLDSERQELFYREPFIAKFKTRKEDKVFYVANYHSRKNSDKPQEEIVYLLDYPGRWDSEAFIITGDFNTTERDMVWRDFYKKGFKSALTRTPTTLKVKCDNDVYLNHAFDNFYYTPHFIKHQADKLDFVGSCENLDKMRALSDHLPVYFQFSIN